MIFKQGDIIQHPLTHNYEVIVSIADGFEQMFIPGFYPRNILEYYKLITNIFREENV